MADDQLKQAKQVISHNADVQSSDYDKKMLKMTGKLKRANSAQQVLKVQDAMIKADADMNKSVKNMKHSVKKWSQRKLGAYKERVDHTQNAVKKAATTVKSKYRAIKAKMDKVAAQYAAAHAGVDAKVLIKWLHKRERKRDPVAALLPSEPKELARVKQITKLKAAIGQQKKKQSSKTLAPSVSSSNSTTDKDKRVFSELKAKQLQARARVARAKVKMMKAQLYHLLHDKKKRRRVTVKAVDDNERFSKERKEKSSVKSLLHMEQRKTKKLKRQADHATTGVHLKLKKLKSKDFFKPTVSADPIDNDADEAEDAAIHAMKVAASALAKDSDSIDAA